MATSKALLANRKGRKPYTLNSNRVIEVHNVGPNLTQETLWHFFELEKRSGGGDVENVVIFSKWGLAWVQFTAPEVAARVLSRGTFTVNQYELKITPVTVVVVQDVKQDYVKEIERYFRNSPTAFVELVEDTFFDSSLHLLYIRSKNASVVSSVLSSDHTIGGETLIVSLPTDIEQDHGDSAPNLAQQADEAEEYAAHAWKVGPSCKQDLKQKYSFASLPSQLPAANLPSQQTSTSIKPDVNGQKYSKNHSYKQTPLVKDESDDFDCVDGDEDPSSISSLTVMDFSKVYGHADVNVNAAVLPELTEKLDELRRILSKNHNVNLCSNEFGHHKLSGDFGDVCAVGNLLNTWKKNDYQNCHPLNIHQHDMARKSNLTSKNSQNEMQGSRSLPAESLNLMEKCVTFPVDFYQWNAFKHFKTEELKELESAHGNSIEDPTMDIPQVVISGNQAVECREMLFKCYTTFTKDTFTESLDHLLVTPARLQEEVYKVHKDCGRKCFLQTSKDHKRVIITGISEDSCRKAKDLLQDNLGISQERASRFPVTTQPRNRGTLVNTSGSGTFASGFGPLQMLYQQIVGNGICLEICEGDITAMDVGAIVNAANVRLLHGGGVARAISSAAGPQLERECRAYIAKNGSLKVGEVVPTNGGNLKSPLVFHAVGPMWNDYANKLHCSQLLMLAFHNCFKLAEDLKVTSIAVPAISSGIFGVPKLIVAKAMYDAAMEFSTTTKKKGYVKKITYVTIDPEMNKTIKLAFEKEGRLDTGLNTGSSSTSNPQVPMGHPARGNNKLINAYADDKSAENPVVVPARPGRAGTNHAHTIQNSKHLSAEATGTAVQNYNTRDFPAGGQAYGNLHRLHSHEEEGMDTVDGDYPSETGNIFGAVTANHVNGDLGLTRDQSSVGARHKVADGIHKTAASKSTEHESNDKDDDCAICLDTITNKKTLDKCKHSFCQGCINESFRVQGPKCPLCGELYGVVIGNQPKDGRITVTRDPSIRLPGYEQFGTYIIEYYFPDGLQTGEHPYPGKYYQGTYRKAYLPGNKEGKELLKLLEKAFENRQTFTVGRSNTTGRDSVVVWNDIHHKTSTHGGPQAYGYPDPDYLNRLRDELAAKGIK